MHLAFVWGKKVCKMVIVILRGVEIACGSVPPRSLMQSYGTTALEERCFISHKMISMRLISVL